MKAIIPSTSNFSGFSSTRRYSSYRLSMELKAPSNKYPIKMSHNVSHCLIAIIFLEVRSARRSMSGYRVYFEFLGYYHEFQKDMWRSQGIWKKKKSYLGADFQKVVEDCTPLLLTHAAKAPPTIQIFNVTLYLGRPPLWPFANRLDRWPARWDAEWPHFRAAGALRRMRSYFLKQKTKRIFFFFFFAKVESKRS